MRKLFLVLVPVFLLVVAAGCSTMPTTLTPVLTTTPIVGPIVVVVPFGPSVSVIGMDADVGYSLVRISADTARGVSLPNGYRVPQRIEVRGTKGWANGKHFSLLFGPGELPMSPDRIIRIPLTEEIRIGPLREGLTQVLFEEVPPK